MLKSQRPCGGPATETTKPRSCPDEAISKPRQGGLLVALTNPFCLSAARRGGTSPIGSKPSLDNAESCARAAPLKNIKNDPRKESFAFIDVHSRFSGASWP